MAVDGTARSSREVLAACHRGLALPELVRQASAGLSRAVAFDRSCWHSIDPATAMLTGAVKDNFQADARFARYERAVPDVNKFAYLARRRRPAGILSVATEFSLDRRRWARRPETATSRPAPHVQPARP